MDPLTRSILAGGLLAFVGLGIAVAVTPLHLAPGSKAVVLATGDGWGEVEPCG